MCGLVGAAGDTTGKVKDVFTDLLMVDGLRGLHSTGAAVVHQKEREIDLFKAPGPSQPFVCSQPYQTMLRQHSLQALIGHNRYATIGSHTAENAHPFAFDNLVGAHNGTLDKHVLKKLHGNSRLNDKKVLEEVFGTDSEAIYSQLNHDPNPQELVNIITGAWALTWYDRRNNTINFLRNDKRPLFYAYSKDRCTVFWASEKEMLEFVLMRNNVSRFEDTTFQVEPNTHVSWEIPPHINAQFEPPSKVECKRPIPPVTHYNREDYYGYGEHWHGGSYSHVRDRNHGGSGAGPFAQQTGSGNSTNSNSPSAVRNQHFHGKKGRKQRGSSSGVNWNINTEKFRPPYKDYYGKIINKQRFTELVGTGCVFCRENNMKWGEFIQPIQNDLDGRSLFLCKECYDDDDVRELVNACVA